MEFGTFRGKRVDSARVTVEGTAADDVAETTVPAVAGLGRLWYDSNEATLVSDDSTEAGALYFGDDDFYGPSVVIGSGWPEINSAARLSLADLRALSDALRHKVEIVEQGGVEK